MDDNLVCAECGSPFLVKLRDGRPQCEACEQAEHFADDDSAHASGQVVCYEIPRTG